MSFNGYRMKNGVILILLFLLWVPLYAESMNRELSQNKQERIKVKRFIYIHYSDNVRVLIKRTVRHDPSIKGHRRRILVRKEILKRPTGDIVYSNNFERIIENKVKTYIIDDFEDGNYLMNPKWKVRDNLLVSIVPNQKTAGINLGNKSWLFEGRTLIKKIGYAESELDIDGSDYSKVQLQLYGNGMGSGTLMIHLYDQDAEGLDIYSGEVVVDWEGWKTIDIPFDELLDINPDHGDNILNPVKNNDLEGFVKVKLIGQETEGDSGKLDIKIDHILLLE
ncbi:MAG: hypothetical protein HRT90_07655 [Candidatus Margulisbacteria bacterium]|nr:hypothetical protein [Candidatus Margulisiibacteriota bacterium]